MTCPRGPKASTLGSDEAVKSPNRVSGIGGKQLSAAINMQEITRLTRLRPFARILPDGAEDPARSAVNRALEKAQPWRWGLDSTAAYSAS